MLEAATTAIADAGLTVADIDGIIPPPGYTTSEELAANLGIDDLRLATTVHMGGASPTASLQHAALAVRGRRRRRNVLVVVGWNGYSAFRPARGRAAPAARARRAARSPTSLARLLPAVRRARAPRSSTRGSRRATSSSTARSPPTPATIAVTFREHAQLNEKALMRGTPLTMDDYLASPLGVASRSACSTAASRPTARPRSS